jgi:serine/threonine protein kinase
VAVSLFHTNNLAHFDLKPANIFIDEDVNAVLGDFGESRFFVPSEDAGTISALGTMLYMSPEMVRNEKLDNVKCYY